MTDGIAISYEIVDFPQWRLRMPFEIHSLINTDNGIFKSNQIKDNSINGKLAESDSQIFKHVATYQTYKIVITEVIRENQRTRYYLKIDGSLHKNKFRNGNSERFYHTDVINEINSLCNTLEIDSKRAKIDNLEFGVNIETAFSPILFLTRYLVRYKHLPFNMYRPCRMNRQLGYVCDLTQYEVKIYDKGYQKYLKHNLMRFELRFNKMLKINQCGIYYLHDLTNPDNINRLKGLLLDAWDNVLLYEPMELPANANLTDLQKELIRCGDNTRHWVLLHKTSKTQYDYHRKVFKELLRKYGKGYHIGIRLKIGKEWDYLLNTQLCEFTIKVIGKNAESGVKTPRRFCISCNREITHQKVSSKFCSPKFVGVVEAHKCRNTDSNKRNNFKNKINRINSKGVLFNIEPFLSIKGVNYRFPKVLPDKNGFSTMYGTPQSNLLMALFQTL